MRISRIFYKNLLATGESVSLDVDAAHYLSNVLRLKQGDKLVLFNGEAGDVEGTITSVSRKEIVVSLGKIVAKPAQPALHIHLGIGLSRGDRMDYAIQKSVELGVGEISPLYTEFGEVKLKEAKRLENKLRHWQRIAISACEQCGSQKPPQIQQPISFNDFIENSEAETRLILDASADKKLSDFEVTSPVQLLIGPEGGFSSNEIASSNKQGFELVSLGPRILRTETAPVAALAILQSLYGD